MTQKPFSSEELASLLGELIDGQLTADGKTRLAGLLCDNPEAQQLYHETMGLHARLHLEYSQGAGGRNMPGLSGMPPGASFPALPTSTLRPWVWPSVVMGSVLLGCLVLVTVWWTSQPHGTVPSAPAEYLATLVSAADCHWESAGQELMEGARLLPGQYKLCSGWANIRFDSGPELLMQGPARLTIDGRTAATVLKGTVILKNNVAGERFELSTPTSKLVDLGTEYAVKVSADGEELHVLDGQVGRSLTGQPQKTEQVSAGEARRYSERKMPGEAIPLDRNRFAMAVPAVSNSDQAKPLVYEGFYYPRGPIPRDASGGFGWGGPWLGYPRPLSVEPEGLHRSGDLRKSGATAVSAVGLSAIHRKLAFPIRLDEDGIHFFSLLFHRSHDHPDSINAFVVVLRNHKENRDDKTLRMGVAQDDQVLFVTFEGGGARTAMPLRYDTTYLLVGKIVAARSAPDQVFLKIYGPEDRVDRHEPSAWSLASRPVHSDAMLDEFIFHVNSQSRQQVGEIRLGTSWAAIAGPWSP